MPCPDSPDNRPLCERVQQFRARMRARCAENRSAGSSASPEASTLPVPCLLQAWRKRIEQMGTDDSGHSRRAHGHRHFGHRRPCFAASSSTESDDQEPLEQWGPPRCPRLHPRLERQQAVCSLSGLFGFSPASPPPEPEIYAKPRHRRHPYGRCGRDDEHS